MKGTYNIPTEKMPLGIYFNLRKPDEERNYRRMKAGFFGSYNESGGEDYMSKTPNPIRSDYKFDGNYKVSLRDYSKNSCYKGCL